MKSLSTRLDFLFMRSVCCYFSSHVCFLKDVTTSCLVILLFCCNMTGLNEKKYFLMRSRKYRLNKYLNIRAFLIILSVSFCMCASRREV